jgi:hypothetical protein
MWVILEFIVLAFVVLFAITDFFYPLLTGKPLFGTFRKKVQTDQLAGDPSLKEKLEQAKEKIKEVKDIQNEVTQHFKSAEQLKAEADDLLNNPNQ